MQEIQSHFIIRVVQLADYQVITELSYQTYAESYRNHPANTPEDEIQLNLHLEQHFTPSVIAKELQNPNNTFWLVEEAEQAIAYAKIIRHSIPEKIKTKNALHLDKIYVLKAHHGKGIGKKLLTEIEQLAHNEQYDWLWLTVWEANKPAVDFYLKAGFETFGTTIFVMGNRAYQDPLMLKKLGSFV
jgi:diamine N-acetyltransferase